jgi:iron complex outermembrane receptor protein
MTKFIFFLFSIFVFLSSSLLAETLQRDIEIIQVLAPKNSVLLASDTNMNGDFNDQFTFNENRTIADRLITIPGVSLNGQGGQFQSYSIRGLSRGRVRTEIDGIPIITDRSAGNSTSFIASDLFTTGQVIKGPSSALYGTQALGGVVSLTTAMADESFIKLSGQTNSTGIDLTMKHQADEFSGAFSYQNQTNDEAPNSDELNTEFERASGVVRYQYESENFTTFLSWLPSYGKNIGKSNNKYLLTEVSAYPEEIHSLAQIQINGYSDWSAKLFHHYQNWDSTTLKYNEYDASNHYQSHTLGGQWLSKLNVSDFDSYIGVDWLSRAGVNITSQYQLLEAQTELGANMLTAELSGSENNLALYNKNSWRWGQTNMEFAVRYDWLEQQSGEKNDDSQNHYGNELNGSLTVGFPVTSSLNAELNLANGFRNPTLSELYFNGRTPRGLIIGNRDLLPETSLGGQLSLSWQESELFSIQAALYHYSLDNYIERFEQTTDQFSYRNLKSANIQGGEVELQWHKSDTSDHYISYHKQTGYDHQNQTLDDLSPEKLSWVYLVSYGKLSVVNSVSNYFKVNKVGDSETSRGNFLLWDLSVDYQLNSNKIISATVNNVTNKNYYTSLDEDASLQPKQNVRLSIRWEL